MVFLGLFLVDLVPIMPGCYIWVGVGMDMVSPLVLVRVATISFLLLCLNSLVIQMGPVSELFAGTLKLRYSLYPFFYEVSFMDGFPSPCGSRSPVRSWSQCAFS